jgi:hypothetical protein
MSLAGEFQQLLAGLCSQDKAVREEKQQLFKQAKAREPDNVVVGLMQLVAAPAGQVEQATKLSALVYLRQVLNKGAQSDDFLFPRITPQHKKETADGLLLLYKNETDEKIRKSIGYAISKLAEYVCDTDDPRGWLVQGGNSGWPELVPTIMQLASPQANNNPSANDSALRLLKELVESCQADVVANQAQVGSLLEQCLSPQVDLKVRSAAVLLIGNMVEEMEKKHWAKLQATVPVTMQVCEQLAAANKEEDLSEIVQAFIDIAGVEPDFFKTSTQSNPPQPVSLMAQIVKAKEADESLRQLANEFITSFAEKKPKWLIKNVPVYAKSALESCMVLMLEVEDGEQPLKEWAGRMDDEEGEEDHDEMFHSGEECIDRLVEALGMDALAQDLFQLVGAFIQQEDWKAKHAALAAVKQTVEYIEDPTHMAQCAQLLLSNVKHPHPRVRYTALHAIGQLANDKAPQFQEQFHSQVMPTLLELMDDPVDRVAAMSMSAFVSFGEELDAVMPNYAAQFMQKLGQRLTTSKHRGISEESITAIAVIAGVIGDAFKEYYGTVMPLLKEIVTKASGEKETRLRGKAFECMSLLGVAVGKEKFLPDAKDAIESMLKMSAQADETQREYIKEAVERIVHCLKKDFLPFCPYVLPNVLQKLDLSEEILIANSGGDDDEAVEVQYKGKMIKVKTQRFEEMHQSAALLNSFCTEMEDAFFDCVGDTAKVLVGLLDCHDDISYLCEEARAEAFTAWSLLIEVATKSIPARGAAAQTLATELLFKSSEVCMKLLENMQAKDKADNTDISMIDVDTEALYVFAHGLAESLKTAPSGSFPADKGNAVMLAMFKLIDASFIRTEKWKRKLTKTKEGAPPELQGDEDDEEQEDPIRSEESCRRSFEEVVGALMKNNPAAFLQYTADFGTQLQKWLQSKDNLVLALHFACDLLEHLKEQSCAMWPIFMQHIFNGLLDKDADVRTAAAYAVNLAAGIPAFAEAAPDAFRKLATLVTGPAPKKRDPSAKVAMDNVVAALLSLGLQQPGQCPGDINALSLAVNKLPLREDTEEAQKVHAKVVDLVIAQHAGLLGPKQENVGKILSVLAEVYKQDDISKKEIDEKIKSVFKQMPPAALQNFASSFSEKQQKRIEKIMAS